VPRAPGEKSKSPTFGGLVCFHPQSTSFIDRYFLEAINFILVASSLGSRPAEALTCFFPTLQVTSLCSPNVLEIYPIFLTKLSMDNKQMKPKTIEATG